MIPNAIVRDLIRCASLYTKARALEGSIERRLDALGFDTSVKLRDGSGNGLDELQYGNIPNYTLWEVSEDGKTN